MSDLESVDYEFFRSLEWIRRGEGVDFQQLGLNFSVDEEVAGKVGGGDGSEDSDEDGGDGDDDDGSFKIIAIEQSYSKLYVC